MMQDTSKSGCAFVVVALSVGPLPASFGDIVFHAWVEAPEAVEAGSTFTASVWMEATGSSLDNDVNALASLTLDVVASGLSASFSEATLFIPGFSAGTQTDNALLEVSGFNHPSISPFTTQNPIRVFETSVTVAPNFTGSLEITLAQSDGWDFMMAWWIDYTAAMSAFDTDPGSSRVVTPALVRVIPPPASAAVLALAGLGAARRRR